jgi:hypothetical protein
MKASKWNTMDPPGPPDRGAIGRWAGLAWLSVGALGSGLLGGFDLVYEPFGSIMVFSQTVSILAACAILFTLAVPRIAPRPVLVRVRR